MNHNQKLAAFSPVLMLISGCVGAPDHHLVPVAGTLLYRDKPVKMVAIQLVPDGADSNSRLSAAGQIDGEGHFTLTSAPHGEGAAPGVYKAFFAGYGASALPQRYTNPKTGLSVTVPEQGLPDLVLNLAE